MAEQQPDKEQHNKEPCSCDTCKAIRANQQPKPVGQQQVGQALKQEVSKQAKKVAEQAIKEHEQKEHKDKPSSPVSSKNERSSSSIALPSHGQVGHSDVKPNAAGPTIECGGSAQKQPGISADACPKSDAKIDSQQEISKRAAYEHAAQYHPKAADGCPIAGAAHADAAKAVAAVGHGGGGAERHGGGSAAQSSGSSSAAAATAHGQADAAARKPAEQVGHSVGPAVGSSSQSHPASKSDGLVVDGKQKQLSNECTRCCPVHCAKEQPRSEEKPASAQSGEPSPRSAQEQEPMEEDSDEDGRSDRRRQQLQRRRSTGNRRQRASSGAGRRNQSPSRRGRQQQRQRTSGNAGRSSAQRRGSGTGGGSFGRGQRRSRNNR